MYKSRFPKLSFNFFCNCLLIKLDIRLLLLVTKISLSVKHLNDFMTNYAEIVVKKNLFNILHTGKLIFNEVSTLHLNASLGRKFVKQKSI